ncbi:hypothetical protein CXG81DRAFT_28366 [Caulochytrium protostelioides]|uniref:Uncharacterized protein n=1 Tax=Caulochytrium protostelioides TaxID=1555241 RepID=A0A4P9WZ68_9FUNG|nr:hypothetical protein CXG81DRAFT_28366 [Caulochytrium protostelioides]|eukprot:RKO98839.1 hypothetical protein CXG81DRAFT_28366 [Caulochytrium protostelioides]
MPSHAEKPGRGEAHTSAANLLGPAAAAPPAPAAAANEGRGAPEDLVAAVSAADAAADASAAAAAALEGDDGFHETSAFPDLAARMETMVREYANGSYTEAMLMPELADRAWLQAAVFPALAEGLKLLVRHRPPDPCDFLAMILLRYSRSASQIVFKAPEVESQPRSASASRGGAGDDAAAAMAAAVIADALPATAAPRRETEPSAV